MFLNFASRAASIRHCSNRATRNFPLPPCGALGKKLPGSLAIQLSR